MKKESLERGLDSLKIETQAISDILNYLDKDAFAKAVDALCKTRVVHTCASGNSGIAAEKFAHCLNCAERPAFFLSPAKAVHGGLGSVQKDDVVVFVSRGGKTAELIPIIDVSKKKGAIIIAITENMQSPLAQAADIIVSLKIEKESDKFNFMATSSFVATIALFDAMLCAILEETNYTREMFGVIHPGGAVGARLNAK